MVNTGVLTKYEERYQNLIETDRDVFFAISPKNTITSVNDVFENLTGWPGHMWIGKSFSSLIHPEDVSIAQEKVMKNLLGETNQPYELRIRSKSGAYKMVTVMTTPAIRKGMVVGIFGIAHDVTDTVKTEKIYSIEKEQISLSLNSFRNFSITKP